LQLSPEHEATRNFLFSKFSKINEKNFKNESQDIFSTLKSELIAVLKFSFFPRFIRSKFCPSNQFSFKKHLTTLKYRDEDFHQSFINDDEITQMNTFLDDTLDWELISSPSGINNPNVFLSKQNLVPYSKLFSEASCFKIEGLIPENIESVACVAFTQSFKRVQTLSEIGDVLTADDVLKKFNYDSESERKSIVRETFSKSVFPINTPRYSKRVETIDYDPQKGTIIYFHKPCLPEMYQGQSMDWDKKNKIKFKNFKTGEIFETEGYFTCTLLLISLRKISENMTKVSYIIGLK
jgi:hypothetical protein